MVTWAIWSSEVRYVRCTSTAGEPAATLSRSASSGVTSTAPISWCTSTTLTPKRSSMSGKIGPVCRCSILPTAANVRLGSLEGIWPTVKGTLFTRYRDEGALELLDEPLEPAHPLVQIAPSETLEETRA